MRDYMKKGRVTTTYSESKEYKNSFYISNGRAIGIDWDDNVETDIELAAVYFEADELTESTLLANIKAEDGSYKQLIGATLYVAQLVEGERLDKTTGEREPFRRFEVLLENFKIGRDK